jgi:hypothetical protein
MSDEIESSQFVKWTPARLEAEYLKRLMRRYINKLPEAAIERLEVAASAFTPGIRSGDRVRLSPMLDLEAKTPLYVQGEMGVGKTAIPEGAAKKFCEIAGLNFVKNPKNGYIPGPDDFVFVVVDMSGKSNISDIAGIPMREKISGDDGVSVMDAVKTEAGVLAK